MKLRPRQEVATDRADAALKEHGNTLLVAPTGAGKTIMGSAVAERLFRRHGPVLFIQHRDELTQQNEAKFRRFTGGRIQTGVYDSKVKSWAHQGVTFGMVQTLIRHLDEFPDFGAIVIDEGHHAVAETYLKIIERVRGGSDAVPLFLLTATPGRGDKKGLRRAGVTNCCDQITVGELIASGHLVPPRAYVLDIGMDAELAGLKPMRSGEYSMDQVDELLNVEPVLESMVDHWQDKAADRLTVAFCPSVDFAGRLSDVFWSRGVSAAVVSDRTPRAQRASILRGVDAGHIQVICNVAVLTEGWDCQPVSCVMLCRPSSFQSTMVQMIGRGLRVVDQTIYPGVLKTDCIVLDFGRSILTHGGIEQLVDLDGKPDTEPGPAPCKSCPECDAIVPIAARECPVCGFVFEPTRREQVEKFGMTVIDIIGKSPFRWLTLTGADGVGEFTIAYAWSAWAVVFRLAGDLWVGFGGWDEELPLPEGAAPDARPRRRKHARHVATGTQVQCLAACDDHLLEYGDKGAAKKSKAWLRDELSLKQAELLGKCGYVIPDGARPSKYEASCRLEYIWNHKKIVKILSTLPIPT